MIRHLFTALSFVSLVASGLAACATTSSLAGPEAARAPLIAPDGETRELGSLLSAQPVTVLVWWASQCPCVARYASRVTDLAARFPDVAFFQIASNADDGAAEVAAAQGQIPIFRDVGGALARRLGVISTPTAVVLDATGAVRYRGWIDNERKPGAAGREAWLEEALAAITRGEGGLTQRPVWGCTITRSIGETGGSCHAP